MSNTGDQHPYYVQELSMFDIQNKILYALEFKLKCKR